MDTLHVQVAARMVRAQAAADTLWPGFWPRERAFLIVRDTAEGGALLYTPHAPPAAYRALPDAALPRELRGHLYLHTGYPEGLSANAFHTRYAVGSDSGIPALPLKGRGLFHRLDFYYHEAFHGYQQGGHFMELAEEPLARFGKPLADTAATRAPEFRRLGDAERRLLARSLEVTHVDSLRALLRDYLAIRHHRVRHPSVWAAERRIERWEGSATFVGCHAAAVAAGEPATRALACIREQLEHPVDDFPSYPEADARLMRWRQYGTGAALSLALERLGVPWRAPLAAGTALDRQVTAAVGFDTAAAPALVERALRRADAVPRR